MVCAIGPGRVTRVAAVGPECSIELPPSRGVLGIHGGQVGAGVWCRRRWASHAKHRPPGRRGGCRGGSGSGGDV